VAKSALVANLFQPSVMIEFSRPTPEWTRADDLACSLPEAASLMRRQ